MRKMPQSNIKYQKRAIAKELNGKSGIEKYNNWHEKKPLEGLNKSEKAEDPCNLKINH